MTINTLIEQNEKIISNIKEILLKKLPQGYKETLAALKINELILLELKYKINYKNEKNIILVLNKMQSNLNLELLKNS